MLSGPSPTINNFEGTFFVQFQKSRITSSVLFTGLKLLHVLKFFHAGFANAIRLALFLCALSYFISINKIINYVNVFLNIKKRIVSSFKLLETAVTTSELLILNSTAVL